MHRRTLFKSYAALLAALLSLAATDIATGAGDPKRGAQVFQACAACHSVERGEHMTGPSLAGILGHKAGTAEGFLRYSEAMKRSGVVWSEGNLDKWLADPAQFVAGTSMTFAGLEKSKDREDVIAYLKAVAEGKAPSAQSGRMGMMTGRANLKNAPPQGQVASISHCGDTYTVTTADGKTDKVWEFNLRFKTDAGKLGPPPGKPVIVGAGMQGDRASVVFAAPSEISGFIKQSCQ
jgi:cytochrome c